MWLQEKLGAHLSELELADLRPATDYSVTLYALWEEEPSEPVTAVASTRERPSDTSSLCPPSTPHCLSLFFTGSALALLPPQCRCRCLRVSGFLWSHTAP